LDYVPEKDRPAVAAANDEQLDRAEDLLKGLIRYNHLTEKRNPEKMAQK
jgi:hypothetical protein